MKGKRNDETDLTCGLGTVPELRARIRAGILREQSREQAWQAACRGRQGQLLKKMQAGYLPKQSSGQERSAPGRRRQKKFHAEVPEGSIAAVAPHRRVLFRGLALLDHDRGRNGEFRFAVCRRQWTQAQSGNAVLTNSCRIGYSAASWEMAVSSLSFKERGGATSGLLSFTNPASHKAC